MRIGMIRNGVALAALMATAGGRVAGDEAALSRKTMLEFRVVATWSKGATHPIGSFGEQLEEGGSTTGNMQVRVDTPADASPCQSSVTGSVSPPAAPDGPILGARVADDPPASSGASARASTLARARPPRAPRARRRRQSSGAVRTHHRGPP